MKADKNKDLEKFVDKLMNETSLESPSPGFTSKLMMQVHMTAIEKATVYKPLISKRIWVVIFGFIFFIIGYFVFKTGAPEAGWLDKLKFDSLDGHTLGNLSSFKFSSATAYAAVLAAIMLLVQVTVLKKYFAKRNAA